MMYKTIFLDKYLKVRILFRGSSYSIEHLHKKTGGRNNPNLDV